MWPICDLKRTGTSYCVQFYNDSDFVRNCSGCNVQDRGRNEDTTFCNKQAIVQGVPLPTKPGSSLIILLQTHSDTHRYNFTTDTFLFISHTTNVLLFKSRCNIFIGFGIINPLPVQFKAVLRGQKGCVFFSGHLNLPTRPEIGLPSREKNHNN